MKRIAIAIVFMSLAAFSVAQPPAKNDTPVLKMALVNIRSQFSDGPDAKANQSAIDANLKRHAFFINKVAAEGAEFVGFPELSLNGYHFSKNMTWLRLDGPEIKLLQKIAVEKKTYISVGVALEDTDGKRYNAQIVIDPQGRIVGVHRKILLTKEKGFTEAGSEHKVFDVKGLKMGICICADGTERKNLQVLVDNGAQLIYGPHANTTGGTSAGWYRFRAAWGGTDGWIAQMKVHAALHNNAGLANPEFGAPESAKTNSGFASGAWFIGPDGRTLAQMPPSTLKSDSKEYVLRCDVPISKR
jgi:predicted amidohydrolase